MRLWTNLRSFWHGWEHVEGVVSITVFAVTPSWTHPHRFALNVYENHAGKFLRMYSLLMTRLKHSEREKRKLFYWEIQHWSSEKFFRFSVVEKLVSVQIQCESPTSSLISFWCLALKNLIKELSAENFIDSFHLRGCCNEKQIQKNVGSTAHDRRAVQNYLSN